MIKMRMGFILKIVVPAAALFTFAFSASKPVNAATTSQEIQEAVKQKLDSVTTPNLKISGATVDLNANYDFSDLTVQQELNSEVSALVEKLETMNSQKVFSDNVNQGTLPQPQKNPVIGNSASTMSFSYNGSNNYTAYVWSGVPGIGWGHINQDFTATVSGGKISSLTKRGSSYPSGITWAQWTANYTDVSFNSSKTTVNISMHGTLNYTLKLLGGNLPATFLAQGKVKSGRIVDITD
ncbi:hypothetical protein [Schleiferilactobacillus shenzhenensis]|uniref:DUF5626 domain-containing protein n=1 Tax=Schleiferilactobacillus shenzhenensis LY-73 TaxID=1231336 RepID=U4TNX9_9LACO|nr:hypothetical protein [Schleiferilactobacillus shenzhenensis]ERL66596.1 hypothetical protein L248_0275 [Schleiferilactobacillus shenzhenensis LY-73]